MEKKRWRLARLLIWMAILGGAASFWLGVGVAFLAWLR